MNAEITEEMGKLTKKLRVQQTDNAEKKEQLALLKEKSTKAAKVVPAHPPLFIPPSSPPSHTPRPHLTYLLFWGFSWLRSNRTRSFV